MTTQGIQAVFVETHNWGATARFFQALGYELEFETDHASGQLRNGDGPSLFVAEVPADQEPGVRIVLGTPDADTLQLDPVVDVAEPFEATHWGTRLMTVRDPDGRPWSIEAPGADVAPTVGHPG